MAYINSLNSAIGLLSKEGNPMHNVSIKLNKRVVLKLIVKNFVGFKNIYFLKYPLKGYFIAINGKRKK